MKSIAALAAGQSVASSAAAQPGIRLVLLDIGGTIIQDRGDVPVAVHKAFEKHGLAVEPAEIARWRGASKREMIRQLVALRTKPGTVNQAELCAAIYQDFSTNLDEAYRHAEPVAGAEDAFVAMRAADLLLATTSGFDRELTASMFRRLNWEKYFVASISGQDVALGRPAPYMIFRAMEAARVLSVAEVVAVGDTPLDLQAANNAGLRGAIGVLTGAGTRERMQQEAHTHLLSSVADLPAALSSGF